MRERLCRYFTRLIPDTTNRKTNTLPAYVAPAHIAATVIQPPGLLGRPPFTCFPNAVETSKGGTVATRKSGKATFIGSAGIGTPPMRRAGSLQLAAYICFTLSCAIGFTLAHTEEHFQLFPFIIRRQVPSGSRFLPAMSTKIFSLKTLIIAKSTKALRYLHGAL